MFWYSQLFKHFPQFVVIHTVKGFSIVSESEIGVFLKLSCFLCDPTNVGNLVSSSSASLKPCLCVWKVYDRFFLFFSRQFTTCNLPSIFTKYCNLKLRRSNHHSLSPISSMYFEIVAVYFVFSKLSISHTLSLASQVLAVKNPPASARDTRDAGLIPGSGRSPGEGNGKPLQYSCLEKSMDRGAWWATVHGVAQSQTRLNN